MLLQKKELKIKNFDIEIVAEYKIAALVLGKEKYYFSHEASLVPIDLALGWGVMADKKKLTDSNIKITQGGRFYRWWVPDFNVLNAQDIAHHSANTHIIPANSIVNSYLSSVTEGDYIYMEGYLVNFKSKEKTFSTSLTRSDVEAGACEILLVNKIIHII